MILPLIVYNAGAGNVSLPFTFPPIGKPGTMERSTDGTSIGGAGSQSGTRTDSVTISGLVQSVWFRTDLFLTLDMQFVPIADIANWAAFIDYAETGGEFHYHPDATSPVYNTFTLEETDWNPTWAFAAPDPAYGGVVNFTMKMRYVPGSDGSGS